MKQLWQYILLFLCLLVVVTGVIFFWTRLIKQQNLHRVVRYHTVRRYNYPRPPITSLTQATSSAILDASIASTGCNVEVTTPVGTTSTVTITSNGEQRTYFVYLPLGFDNTKQHAVILNFHGYAATGLDQERSSQFTPIANAHDVIMVYPNGSFDRSGFRGWNTGLHPAIKSNDVEFVTDILNQLQKNFCVNPHQIYATGFSNGGGFVNLLACKLSNRIAAFAPVSGSYVTPFKLCDVKRPVPVIEFHGTADQSVPYAGNAFDKELSVLAWIAHWVKQDGCANKPTILFQNSQVVEYSWPKCQSESAVIHYEIINGRHLWPFISFPQLIQGKVQYLDAASVIWRFFAAHPLP